MKALPTTSIAPFYYECNATPFPCVLSSVSGPVPSAITGLACLQELTYRIMLPEQDRILFTGWDVRWLVPAGVSGTLCLARVSGLQLSSSFFKPGRSHARVLPSWIALAPFYRQ